MRTRPQPRKFSSGELAPWLDGITTVLTQQGCRTLENFIVKKQGQAVRRPGSFLVKEVKDSTSQTMLIPVVIDDTHRYQLELGNSYIRVFNQATHIYNGTEIVSPWSTGDLSSLRWNYIPNEKALYFADHHHEMSSLTWTSDTVWSLSRVTVISGRDMAFYSYKGKQVLTKDGKTWARSTIGVNSSTLHVYGGFNLRGTSMVVSQVPSELMVSNDSETWVNTLPVGLNPAGVAANDFDEWVCVGGTGSSVAIYESLDAGSTWNRRSEPTTGGNYFAVAYDKTNQVWRVAGDTKQAYSSDGGSTWTSIADYTAGWQPVNMSHGNNLWVAVLTNGSDGRIVSASSTASPWTLVLSIVGGAMRGLAYGEPGGSPLWLATAINGSVYYASGPAVAWNTVAIGVSNEVGTCLWDGHRFVVANSNGFRWLSPDGVNWQTVADSAFQVSTSDLWIAKGVDASSDYEYFNVASHYPSTITYHEGRLVLAGLDARPATIWGSELDVISNFFIGPLASDAYSYDLSASTNVDIKWLMSADGSMGAGILVGTRTSEGMLIGSPQEGITPLTAQFKWISTFGSSNVQPVRIHDTIAFVQRGGEIVRGYEPGPNGDQSLELTIYADHIGKGGITKLEHQDDPQSILYGLRSDGQLLALTFNNARRARYGLSPQVLDLTAEEDTRAWARIKAAPSSAGAAVIESVAVISTNGAEDEVWLIVKRTIGGTTKRYIEYMDTLAVASFAAAHYVDCGVYVTSVVTMGTVGSLTHLAGENVDALIDGTRWLSGLTVAASGTIALAPYSGTAIHVGLPYASYLQTMRGDYGSPLGSGAGLEKKTNNLWLWVDNASAAATFGPSQSACLDAKAEAVPYSTSVALATEVIRYAFPGQWDRDNYIWCAVKDPRPFTLVAILPDSETGDA